MNQQDSKQKKNKHQNLEARIKKQILAQDFDTLRVSYSYLDKKNNSGISSNTRLFFLYHKERVGYINELPKNQLLPFTTAEALPPLKASIELDNIETVNNQKQILKIAFNKADKKQNWQFKCSSFDLAKNWTKRINISMQQRKDDKLNPPRQIIVQQKKLENPKDKQDPSKVKKDQNEVRGSQQNTSVKEGQNDPILVKQERVSDQNNKSNQQILIKQVIKSQQQNQQESRSQPPVFGERSQQKMLIAKPKSTLFVGGVAVENEKDQQQLKNKMQTFQTITSKIKQQYQRKKQQQKKINEQVKNQSQQFSPFKIGKDLLSFATNTKYQIEKMQRQWGYQFAKAYNEYDIVQKFKLYVQIVSNKIIDEFGLEQKKRYYQPQNHSNSVIEYQINGVLFNIYLTQLREINPNAYSFSEQGTIVSNEQAKLAAHQFKNYDYVLRLTQNKGKIRVPLSMMTYYKGFTIYAKVLIPAAEGYGNMDLLQKQLQILQAESRINNSIFQDPEPGNSKIVALQSKAYQKLARAENSNKKFDLCFIDGLKHYLPHDFNNFNKQKSNQRLRWQLIQDDECQDTIMYGQDMCSVASRLKLPQHFRDGINQLTNISKLIYERIDILVQVLQGCEQYFTNSQQLSQIMHRHGINMRYLGLLLQKLKQNWLKQIIMSQIAVRCAKKYLSFDLQDCILNLSQSNLQNVYRFQVKQVINFLNKMLGNSQDTQTFWKQLNRHSQSQFKVSLNRQQINHVYLLQSLQYHCGFKLTNLQYNEKANTIQHKNNNGIQKANSKLGLSSLSSINLSSSNITTHNNKLQLFTSHNPFRIDNFAVFQNKSKVYDLSLTQLYSSVKTIINQHTNQSFQQLKLILNLPRVQNIPSHFKLSHMYKDIVIYLINWISPQQMPNIYYSQDIQLGEVLPTKLLYSLKLAQIRWALKQNKIQESQKIKDWIVDHVNKWIGDCHPILTQLYQIFANYYIMFKQQQKKAVNYCKSAIKNQQKLIGINHHKMADSYYLLSTVYKNYGKKTQAINSLKKAKQIILKSQNEQSQAYGEVCLKMGQLFLSVNETKQSIQSALQAMKVLEKCGNSLAQIEAIQLVCRSYQIEQDWDSYLNLIETTLVNKIPNFVDDIDLTQRIVKVCIILNLKMISENSQVTQKILKIISELPDTTRAPNMAYNFLKVRIEEKVFPHRFLQALVDIEDVLEQIQSNGMLTRWKGFENITNKSLLNKVGINMENRGFNFIATLEALNIFISNSFIEGILYEH